MKGEILSVGTELLLGQLVDTNAPYLAESLSGLGIDVFWISQVGDNQDRLVQALRRGWERSDLIVISGGMGPTGDDLTREAITELLGEAMVVQPDLEMELRAFFARRNRPMTLQNLKQASLIPSAQTLPNPIGTAPGWWVERGGRTIVAMPGVPVEMKRMWEQEVLPRLSSATGGEIILSRTIKTLGIGESSAEYELRLLTQFANPTVATYAKRDGVHVRITAKAPSAEVARGMIAEVEMEVREILGDHVYGVEQDTVSNVVGALLRDRGLSLGTMEFGSTGQLSVALASASSVGDCFAGGLVAGDSRLLKQFGVDVQLVDARGDVSEEVVRGMASAARKSLGADVGLAVACGIEREGARGQHLGRVCSAIDDRGDVVSTSSRYSTTLEEVRRRAVLDTMDLLRRRLIAAGG